MRDVHPGIFVANGGYHYEEEVERNCFAPTLATKTSWRMEENGKGLRPSHVRPTSANGGDWAAGKPCPTISAISAHAGLARVAVWGLSSSIATYGHKPAWRERNKWEREIREKGLRWEGGGLWKREEWRDKLEVPCYNFITGEHGGRKSRWGLRDEEANGRERWGRKRRWATWGSPVEGF